MAFSSAPEINRSLPVDSLASNQSLEIQLGASHSLKLAPLDEAANETEFWSRLFDGDVQFLGYFDWRQLDTLFQFRLLSLLTKNSCRAQSSLCFKDNALLLLSLQSSDSSSERFFLLQFESINDFTSTAIVRISEICGTAQDLIRIRDQARHNVASMLCINTPSVLDDDSFHALNAWKRKHRQYKESEFQPFRLKHSADQLFDTDSWREWWDENLFSQNQKHAEKNQEEIVAAEENENDENRHQLEGISTNEDDHPSLCRLFYHHLYNTSLSNSEFVNILAELVDKSLSGAENALLSLFEEGLSLLRPIDMEHLEKRWSSCYAHDMMLEDGIFHSVQERKFLVPWIKEFVPNEAENRETVVRRMAFREAQLQMIIIMELLSLLYSASKSMQARLLKQKFPNVYPEKLSRFLREKGDSVLDYLCIQFASFSILDDEKTDEAPAAKSLHINLETESRFVDRVIHSARYEKRISSIVKLYAQKFSTHFFSPPKARRKNALAIFEPDGSNLAGDKSVKGVSKLSEDKKNDRVVIMETKTRAGRVKTAGFVAPTRSRTKSLLSNSVQMDVTSFSTKAEVDGKKGSRKQETSSTPPKAAANPLKPAHSPTFGSPTLNRRRSDKRFETNLPLSNSKTSIVVHATETPVKNLKKETTSNDEFNLLAQETPDSWLKRRKGPRLDEDRVLCTPSLSGIKKPRFNE